MMALTIAAREFRSLFISPLAWSVLGVMQLILGFMFLTQLDYFMMLQPRIAGMEDAPGITDLIIVPLFGNTGVLMLLVTPLLTMRLIAEERRNRTLSLLFTAPVSITEIILGKFIGIFGFLMVMVAMVALMPLSLLLGGSLDFGKLLACLLALALLLGSFASVGLYISARSAQPTVAAVTTFGALLGFWIIDWSGKTDDKTGGVLQELSLLHHYENLLRGLISTADLAYFFLVVFAFIVLGIHSLDNDRLQK